MTDLITADLVRLDADLGSDKHAVIRALADVVGATGRATGGVEQIVTDAFAREEKSPTGLKDGIAIPHCRTTGVSEPTLVFARLAPAVDFGAKDGPADLAFLIAAPEGGDNAHLQILTKLARALVKPEFVAGLRAAASADDVVALVSQVVSDAPSAQPAMAGATSTPAAPSHAAAPAGGPTRLVAVTACPTGIAHTYMAAEALEAAARRAGVELVVETQGSTGASPIPAETIRQADAVIFAVDVGVRDRGRFAGKPLVSSGVKRPIDDADAMITEALRYAMDPQAPRVEGSASDGGSGSREAGHTEGWGERTRRVLMTGVSYMIPFVAAGGLLIAIGFLLGGDEIASNKVATAAGLSPVGDIAVNYSIFNLPDPATFGLDHALFGSGLIAYIGVLCFVLGQTAFALFIPAFAGYVAYAIADRPGIAPGFIMGALAANLTKVSDSAGTSVPVTGFLGAIVGGVLAGLIAHWISTWTVPSWARGLMPVMVIPLLTTVIAGFLMLIVLGRPIAYVTDHLYSGLGNLSGSSAVLLGVVIGLMMAFDLGGPLNKVAYAFGVASIGAANAGPPELRVMAAVMLAGMVPPMALGLATVIRPNLFTVAERENGKAGWLLGLSFITEGAIPFAAADPVRVIPSMMLGSAVTGGLAELLHVGINAPHGGIFVIFAVTNVVGYIISLVAGILVGGITVVALKSMAAEPVVAPVA